MESLSLLSEFTLIKFLIDNLNMFELQGLISMYTENS
jgi:hypothetical protein